MSGLRVQGGVRVRKVAINIEWFDLALSHETVIRFIDLAGYKIEAKRDREVIGGTEYYSYFYGDDHPWYPNSDIPRDDENLIRTIEELGLEKSAMYGKIRIVEIPADVEWQIESSDGPGCEWIAEKHKTWGLGDEYRWGRY